MRNYFQEHAVKKLLIIRLSSLGDILLTTPLVRTIKENNPDILIDFLLREQYADVYRLNPKINSILFYDQDPNVLFREIKYNSYDLIIDLQNNLRSHKLIGKLETPILRFGKKHLNKFLLVHFKINRLKNAPPIPIRYADSVPGFSLDNSGLEIFTANNSSSADIPEKAIGFCPGSRHFTKMYPEEYFVQLGRLLTEKGYRIILFGGRSDKEICRRISSSIPGSLDFSNDDQLLATASNMKKCLCIICNDSGLMHLASAVRVPVIAIFGSSVKEFGFSPYRSGKSLILENNLLSCRPCSHIGRDKCPEHHFKCMLDISPEMVFENIEQLLQK